MSAGRREALRGARRTAGLSLVELMVALALGAVLMAGAITLFVNNRATYEVTNDMARLQENARFALEVMTQDIRMAGHTGCVNVIANLTNTLNRDGRYAVGQLSDFGSTYQADGITIVRSGSNAVEGFESGATRWRPSDNLGQGDAILGGAVAYPAVLADSDGITVRYVAGDRSAAVRTVLPSGIDVRDVNNEVLNQSDDLDAPTADASELNTQLIVRNLTYELNDDQAAAVSHCGAGDVFLMNGIARPGDDNGPVFTPSGNSTDLVNATALTRSYSARNRAVVAPLVGVRYFVRLNGAGVPTLYRSRLDPRNAFNEVTEELVDGVRSLQVLYGFDGNDADRVAEVWLTADQQASIPGATVGLPGPDGAGRHDGLAGLVSVKIGLLMETVDEMRIDEPNRGANDVYDVLDERFCHPTAAAVAGNQCTVTLAADNRRRRVFTTTIAVRNFQ